MASQLAGCATLSSQEMAESMRESSDVSIEWADHDSSQQGRDSLDASNMIEARGTQFIVDSNSIDNQDIGVVNQHQEVEELSGAELEKFFQLAYDSGTSLEGDIEARIAGELKILVSLVDADNTVKLPDDYVEAYQNWRPAELAEEIQLFTECDEMVYVIDTVNIRSGPGTDFDKVGSFDVCDELHRVGIGIGTAEGWSKIQLDNEIGTEVYVASKYLSTSKPIINPIVQSNTPQQVSKPADTKENRQVEPAKQPVQNIDYGDDLTPEQAAEARRQLYELIEAEGGTLIGSEGESQISRSEEEYIRNKLNGASYNP